VEKRDKRACYIKLKNKILLYKKPLRLFALATGGHGRAEHTRAGIYSRFMNLFTLGG
jgi:hypothetical protein